MLQVLAQYDVEVAGPVIRRWSRHSRRRVPMNRSAIAFARGAWTGMLIGVRAVADRRDDLFVFCPHDQPGPRGVIRCARVTERPPPPAACVQEGTMAALRRS